MGFTFFSSKTKEEREAEEAMVYQRAIENFNLLILHQQTLAPIEDDESDSRPSERHPVKNSVDATSALHLEEMRKQINDLLLHYPELKPIMARVCNAVSIAMKNPTRETKRELFFAQLAVSRPGDASRGLSATIMLIGISLLVIGIALLLTGATGGSLLLPAFFACLGIIFAIAGSSHKIAISPKEEIIARDEVADNLSKTRKALH